jgi:alpha-glucosidase
MRGMMTIPRRTGVLVRLALAGLALLGPALVGLATPASAAAALRPPAVAPDTVTIEPTQTVITAPGARAVIDDVPFDVSYEQGDGAPALSEVSGGSAAPMLVGPTVDPLPPGADNQHTQTLYAPLSFLVGTETDVQYPGLIWGGNLLSGIRTGIEYSARRVLSTTQVGDGVQLILATDDPTGRRLQVTIAPLGSGAIQLSAQADPANGVAEIGDSFASDPDEGFFGFGGRHNALDQRGEVLSSFVQEENIDGLPGAGTGSLSLFPNGDTAAYDPQAEFFSSRPYGFLLAQPQLARFKLDAGNPDAWNVTATASSLDYVVAPGPAADAIATLTALSGRQPVPPRWALGPMLDRLVKNLGETEADYQADVEADLVNITRYQLPLTAYRIEGWGLGTKGNDGLDLPTEMSPGVQAQVIAKLQAMGIHPLVYFRPWITPGSAPAREGLVVTQADGQPYITTSTTGTPIELLDFTNPAAVRWWQGELDKAFNLGADGFMEDFGEEVLFNMHFHDGETGVTMHNRYPILYSEATREAITAYERTHPHRQLWFFSRSGYSGLPGSAAYEGGNFPGDESTDWSHTSGLASLTSDMLSRAVDGQYGFGTDIGGYYDVTSPPTTSQLFIRWAEWAALSPVFRLHGAGLTGTHTPWSFGAQTDAIYNALSNLHLRAASLILKLWQQATRTGMPVTRPLWLQYPGDTATWTQDQEWLLGPSVLVAPVVTEGAASRSVYFPPGCWRFQGTGARYRGPLTATVSAPLATLPYFFRCGTDPFQIAVTHPRGQPRGAKRRRRA